MPIEEWLSVNDVQAVPKLGVLVSRAHAELGSFIYSAPMDTVTGYDLACELMQLGHCPVVSRFLDEEEIKLCIKEFLAFDSKFSDEELSRVFFAVGVNGDLERFVHLVSLVEAENPGIELRKPNLAIDIAHGDCVIAHTTTAHISASCESIMSGSICTPEAALRAVQAGCTHLRIGVGPGAVCTTRLMTGCGLPNLTAVQKIYQALKRESLEAVLIADGGIKHPGDVVKYLIAGADAVMLGSVLSKARESCGWESGHLPQKHQEILSFPMQRPELVEYKTYRGQASSDFQERWYGRVLRAPEGVSGAFVMRNECQPLADIVAHFEGGLRSAISYLGLSSQKEIGPETCELVRITASGYTEGTPHGSV